MTNKNYIVTGAYVTVKTMTHQGSRIIGLYAAAQVPPDAEPEWIKHHLETKQIAEVADPALVRDAELHPSYEEEMASQDTVGDRVHAGEVARNRAKGAAHAAATRKDNEDKADAKEAAKDADAAKAAATAKAATPKPAIGVTFPAAGTRRVGG